MVAYQSTASWRSDGETEQRDKKKKRECVGVNERTEGNNREDECVIFALSNMSVVNLDGGELVDQQRAQAVSRQRLLRVALDGHKHKVNLARTAVSA